MSTLAWIAELLSEEAPIVVNQTKKIDSLAHNLLDINTVPTAVFQMMISVKGYMHVHVRWRVRDGAGQQPKAMRGVL